jgi:hypothetical protein
MSRGGLLLLVRWTWIRIPSRPSFFVAFQSSRNPACGGQGLCPHAARCRPMLKLHARFRQSVKANGFAVFQARGEFELLSG